MKVFKFRVLMNNIHELGSAFSPSCVVVPSFVDQSLLEQALQKDLKTIDSRLQVHMLTLTDLGPADEDNDCGQPVVYDN